MDYHFYNESLSRKTIAELLSMLDADKVSSEELVWAYLERIAAFDTDGPGLKSVLEFNPDAFAIARERDWERRTGNKRGPLHGIPILVKDAIDTADGMHTTCGSAALKDRYAKKDAFIIEKLREAGAIILGKNSMTELYGFVSKSAPNGYSGLLQGAPLNPFGPGRLKPGGSSGGSAVSVAADFAPASIGTDTAGSIFEPACFNGVVGYKPTVGLISRRGILPILKCQDTPGPITRSVHDAALLANVLVGRDEEDPDTIRTELFKEHDFTLGLEEETLAGKRLGVVTALFEKMGYRTIDNDKEENAALGRIAAEELKKAIAKLQAAGAEIVEIGDFTPAKLISGGTEEADTAGRDTEGYAPGGEVMCQGFKARLDKYLSESAGIPVRSLSDLISWNREHPEAIPYGQDYLEMLSKIKRPVMNASFIENRMNDLSICGEKGIWEAMEHYELNALILPGVAGQGIAATAGNPTISIPAGYTPETGPVGLNLIGDIMCDAELLRIARACEKVLLKAPVPELR
ncbi:MAG: hypothetical protein IJU30_04150 [Lachnospiraceae bacterium]|nr:hypothetical protein [Lachnospiraceae bacterium]